MLQTRRSDDAVIDALVRENFDAIIDEDVQTARLLELAPYGAEAEVSGEGAAAFVESLRDAPVSIGTATSGFVVRAKDVATLTSALRAGVATARPRCAWRCASRRDEAFRDLRTGTGDNVRDVTTLPIRIYGDPVLTQATTEIENIDGRIAALAQTMIETMNEAPGVGLAANQVGVQKRLFVYDKGEGPHVVVNPKILETDGEWVYEEGCLSVPGLSWEITRANAVHLVGFDLDGNEIDVQTDEYEGRIFQHEMDHLDGVLLIERLNADQRREAKQILRQRNLELSASDPDGLHQLLGE